MKLSLGSWQFARCLGAVILLFCLGAQLTRAETPKPKDGPLGMKFVPLPRGTFYMGWESGKKKLKQTEIKKDFEIAVYTVTQGQWQELMGKNPSWFSRTGAGKNKVKNIKDEDLKQFPVEMVSWDDTQEFIKKLNEQEKGKGWSYRLPTEAEWEYACRGGATSEEECSYNFYFAKPSLTLSSKQANVDPQEHEGMPRKGPYLERTTKVGSYPPNKLGLYDMHGNVAQWCENLFDPKASGDRVISDLLPKAAAAQARQLAARATNRVYKSGSWINDAWNSRAANTSDSPPATRISVIGFRLARVPVEQDSK
jgi:formylglycine-generating enzyme required for sulfatase activity